MAEKTSILRQAPAERDRHTVVSASVRYTWQAARDGALKTPMLEGWSQAHGRLDELLASVDAWAAS